VGVVAYTFIALACVGLVWKGTQMLESSSERLAIHYELPDIVTGAVVVAIGSSFPELAAAVLSTLIHGEFELGVAAIVGSALFNILVIPALAGLYSEHELASNRDLVYKDAQFYMLSVAVLLLTFSFAAIYNRLPDDVSILGRVDRWLALIPIVMYGFYVFVQWQDTMEYEPEEEPDEVRLGRQWLTMLGSLVLIVVGVEGLVRAAITYGEYFGTPSFLWGITVVAAGTSIPDAFVSVRAARAGNAVTSLANVLGSNIFDLLVCIPAGVLIAGAATINYSIAAPMMGVLTAATLILFLMMRTRMVVSKAESVALLVVYALFVVWITLESFALIDTVPGLPP
jgi:cation:H+ antiporter